MEESINLPAGNFDLSSIMEIITEAMDKII
jgi:hypothetical protein